MIMKGRRRRKSNSREYFTPNKDGRERITNTTQWPHIVHAQFTMKFERKTYSGSVQWQDHTIEPGIYLPNVGGVRLEDTVLITDHGYENLTLL